MQVLATWDDFSGGHWGNLGPVRAQPNQYGGVNVLTDGQGNLAPMNSPETLLVSTLPTTNLLGLYWNWGGDGRVLAVTMATSTATAQVYGFLPSTTSVTTTVMGSISSTAAINRPDFCTVSDTVYVTVYGGKTWQLTGVGTSSKLTGTYGDAPAGNCIALYGERLVVGGVSDSRFSTVANRIVFSGDDTNNNPTDRTAWETLNYFDIGPTDRKITGLYPTRDSLVVLMEDQTVWLITGVLGSSAVARRVSGYDKGSGALRAFRQTHGAVDPSQTKVWLFNHENLAVQRFNGASMTPLPNVGITVQDRNGTLDDLGYVGELQSIGGPDEIFALGAAITADGTAGLNTARGIVRVAGRLAVFDATVFSAAAIGSNGSGGQFAQANDRYQVIVCTSTGDGSAAPVFKRWYAADAPWSAEVASIGASYHAQYAMGSVQGSALLPYKDLTAKGGELVEAEIEGILVDFIPHPLVVNDDGSSSTTAIGFTVGLNGYGIAGTTRTVSSTTVSGINTSTTSTFTSTIGAQASDVWPNIRTQFFPMRFAKVRGVQVKITGLSGCRIVKVRLLGKTMPSRLA